MPNFSNKQIKNKNSFKKVSPYDIPLCFRNRYFKCLNYFIDYYKKLIADIFIDQGDSLTFPIEFNHLEAYLTGYKFVYIGFDKTNFGIEGVDGFFQVENEIVYIFYNQASSPERIRFTIVHELFHFCQSIDSEFRANFDTLIGGYYLHIDVVYTLLEKATDKATAAYLMPLKHFHKKYLEVKDINKVSNYFRVSAETATYRLKECQQLI